LIMNSIVYERVEHNEVVVGPIMSGEACSVVNVTVAVAHVNSARIILEVVAKDFMAIAKDAEALCVSQVIAVVTAIITMALTDLGARTIEDGVKAIHVAAGFVGNHFVLASAPDKQVIFDERISSRETQPAEAEPNCLGPVPAGLREVVKIIMMHP